MQTNTQNSYTSELDAFMSQEAHLLRLHMHRDGFVAQLIITQSADVRRLLPLDQFPEHLIPQVIRLWSVVTRATVVLHISQAWIAIPTAEERNDITFRPSLSPQRREVLLLKGEARGGVKKLQFLPILRTPNGTFMDFGPVILMPPRLASGFYSDMLPVSTPTDTERLAAVKALSVLLRSFTPTK